MYEKDRIATYRGLSVRAFPLDESSRVPAEAGIFGSPDKGFLATLNTWGPGGQPVDIAASPVLATREEAEAFIRRYAGPIA